MPTGRYWFTRSSGINGFFSNNRASTDALNALSEWSSKQTRRSYEELKDEDETLLARLSWSESDIDAGQDLDNACLSCGVEHSYVGQ